jgi:hypothetical protein
MVEPITTSESGMTPWLDELSYDVCLGHLREGRMGRIALVVGEHPLVLPVHFGLVDTADGVWITLRTGPGASIDHESVKVAFEIDGIDPIRGQGWSVIVEGVLHPVGPDAAGFRAGSESWWPGREGWFVIEPRSITGRELPQGSREWVFHPDAYA